MLDIIEKSFEEQVKEFPKDSNALFAMGLTYLGLKNYELADEPPCGRPRTSPASWALRRCGTWKPAAA